MGVQLVRVSGDKPEVCISERLNALTGIQLSILTFVNEICLKSSGTSTGRIQGKDLANLLGISYDSLKTSIKRLRAKNIISKLNGKQGRGGYFDLSLETEAREFLSTGRHFIGVSGDVLGNVLGDNSDVVSSSSYLKLNTTTNNIDPSLDQIDCSPLKEFGMGKDHIIQIDRAYKKNPEIDESVKKRNVCILSENTACTVKSHSQ